jgi:hypothetical protein
MPPEDGLRALLVWAHIDNFLVHGLTYEKTARATPEPRANLSSAFLQSPFCRSGLQQRLGAGGYLLLQGRYR